jgi:hypothetical protein
LGGAILPDGEFFRIETPRALQRYPNVAASYRDCTFDRKLAMRRRKAQLLGLGHPLVDALLVHLQSHAFRGGAASLGPNGGDERAFSVRILLHADFEDGHREKTYKHYLLEQGGSWKEAPIRFDFDLLLKSPVAKQGTLTPQEAAQLRESITQSVRSAKAEVRASRERLNSIRETLVGLCRVS